MRICSPSSVPSPPRGKTVVLLVTFPILLVVAVGLIGSAMFLTQIKRYARAELKSLGYHRDHTFTGNALTDVPQAAFNWGRSLVSADDLPRLSIDIKFRHLQKLRRRRAESISAGIYVQNDDDLVPAVIRLKDRVVRVKLRLKGDAVVGQFSHDTWSFRIQVRGEDHLFGMRRFNLHPPFARDFQAEPLFLHHVRHLGVLAPRYMFVRVRLNGDDLGIMAIEEHFSKELLESQRRREGVILKFDESKYWAFRERIDRFSSPFGNFRTADLVPFRATRVQGNPVLQNNVEAATGLYRAFAEGTLAPSKVFDARLMGRFLAAVQVWGAWHAASWRNVRFYYNPITALLEPIAYDAELRNLHFHTPEPLHGLILADSTVRAEYYAALRSIADDASDAQLQRELENIQSLSIRPLHRQFPFLKPLNISGVQEAAKSALGQDPAQDVRFVANQNPDDQRTLSNLGLERYRPEDYVLANRVSVDQGAGVLEVRNLIPYPVVVRYRAEETANESLAEVHLPPTSIGADPELIRLPLHGQSGDSVFVFAQKPQAGAWVKTKEYYPARTKRPIPEPSLSAALAHEFLTYDSATNRVTSLPGTWEAGDIISLPEGVGLELTAGTEIRFSPNAALIVRGPTDFAGTSENPITLRALNGDTPWKGIVVLNEDSKARWSHVNVSHTSGVRYPSWILTGSVTIHGGEVEISASSFTDTSAEDALNLVGTRFALRDVDVARVASDGIDFDFSSGALANGAFDDIGFAGGGDALDFSGAVATVSGTRFRHVSDKAISVGERSQVWIDHVEVQDVGVAAVSKDGSYAQIKESRISDALYSVLMAYTKKPEYGGAALEAANLQIDTAQPVYCAQTGSLLRVEGANQSTADFDVDALYATIMHKGP